MKTPFSTPTTHTTGWIDQVDDAQLRRGHPLLDDYRVLYFSLWMDRQLELLDWQFRAFHTRNSVRRALRRSGR